MKENFYESVVDKSFRHRTVLSKQNLYIGHGRHLIKRKIEKSKQQSDLVILTHYVIKKKKGKVLSKVIRTVREIGEKGTPPSDLSCL